MLGARESKEESRTSNGRLSRPLLPPRPYLSLSLSLQTLSPSSSIRSTTASAARARARSSASPGPKGGRSSSSRPSSGLCTGPRRRTSATGRRAAARARTRACRSKCPLVFFFSSLSLLFDRKGKRGRNVVGEVVGVSRACEDREERRKPEKKK